MGLVRFVLFIYGVCAVAIGGAAALVLLLSSGGIIGAILGIALFPLLVIALIGAMGFLGDRLGV